jgi:hypothetical protein
MNIQKNWQNLFWILTFKLFFEKNWVLALFHRWRVEAATNNLRQFRI